ncbi:MAG: hypothetical protein ACOC5D_02880 [Thermoplasmatota archaeon]
MTLAELFIMIMGLIFIVVGLVLSLFFNAPSIFSIGMGVIGLFLLIMPITKDTYKQ